MFLQYRESVSATVPVATTAKGTPLSNLEIDGNFRSIALAIEEGVANNTITVDNDTSSTVYPLWATAAGNIAPKISSAKIRYVPSTDTLTVTNFAGTASNVVTNANLTGMVTSVGNATTVVTNANLTGMVTSTGNATTVVTNANLTGMVTSVGNATTVVTNANLTGEVTSTGNATTVTNAAVINKLLTGYVKAAGTVAATDSVLQAIQKLAANDETNADLTGEVTSTGNATTVTNSAVIAKVLTGFTSGTGTITAADTLLTALQKLYGNDALKAPIASPTFTGVPLTTTAAADTNNTQIASTAYVVGQAASTAPVANGLTAVTGSSLKYARADHVHPQTTPTFRAYLNTADQGLTSGAAATIVQFNTKSFDTVTGYSTGTFKWTPGVAGYYSITAGLQIGGTALSTVTIQIVKNTTVVSAKTTTGTSLNPAGVLISDTIQAGASDTFEIRVTATGSSPLVLTDDTGSYFTGTLVSRG